MDNHMKVRLRIRRGFDKACERAYMAWSGTGWLNGKSVRLGGVESTQSHDLILTFVPCFDAEATELKYWIRAMIKLHR